jgi:hypothetical protein
MNSAPPVHPIGAGDGPAPNCSRTGRLPRTGASIWGGRRPRRPADGKSMGFPAVDSFGNSAEAPFPIHPIGGCKPPLLGARRFS